MSRACPPVPAWCAWVTRRNQGVMPASFLRLEETANTAGALPGGVPEFTLEGRPVSLGPWVFGVTSALTFTARSPEGPPVDVCVAFRTIDPKAAVDAWSSAVVTGPNGAACFAVGALYLWLSDWRQYIGVAELIDQRGAVIFESGPLVGVAGAAEQLVRYAGPDHA